MTEELNEGRRGEDVNFINWLTSQYSNSKGGDEQEAEHEGLGQDEAELGGAAEGQSEELSEC